MSTIGYMAVTWDAQIRIWKPFQLPNYSMVWYSKTAFEQALTTHICNNQEQPLLRTARVVLERQPS